jgi:hypothetical protein
MAIPEPLTRVVVEVLVGLVVTLAVLAAAAS